MSVAFRRESDEEHKEPRFELPIPAGPNLVTVRGRALIDERIATLEAALAGADVEAAEAVRRDLRYWQTRRATALPTAPPADGTIGFGSVVDILLGGMPRRIAIVGDDEANPKIGSIAFTAPLARVLLRAEVGDILPFGGRDDGVEVIAVG